MTILDGSVEWQCLDCEEKENKQNEPTDDPSKPPDASEQQRINKNHLRILQWNADGLYTKMGELKERLSQQDVDVALIQEAKLRKTDRTPRIPGYTTIREDRVGGPGGGLVTFIKENVPYQRLPSVQKDGTEIQKIRIRLSRNKWMTVANVYCPPNNDVGGDNRTLRMDLLPCGDNDIIGGDLNAHSYLWDEQQPENSRGEQVEDFVIEKSFTVLNDGQPTRTNRGTGNTSTPDVTLCGQSWSGKTQWDTGSDIGSSDHQPILVTLTTRVSLIEIGTRAARWKRKGDDRR